MILAVLASVVNVKKKTMDNFDARKWFKKQYLEEGMSDEEIHAIKRYEELSNDDKLKLAKIQAMMDRERSLREDDLEEIARVNMNPDEVFDFMETAVSQNQLNELKDLIMVLGEEWVANGFDSLDIGEYLEDLVYKLVRS